MASEGSVTQRLGEGRCQCLGVISEDLRGKEGGTWSASPVSQMDLLKARDKRRAKPEAAGLFLALLSPPPPHPTPWPPDTPKRPSGHLSSAPPSEEKHLGTERDSACSNPSIRRPPPPLSPGKGADVWQSFPNGHHFMEQSRSDSIPERGPGRSPAFTF